MRLSSLVSGFAIANTVVRATPSPDLIYKWFLQFAQDWSYPRVTAIASNITYPGWSDDIVGRVDITNVFRGNELNTAYLFGLFSGLGQSSTSSTQLIGVPLNQKVQSLVIQGDVAFVSLIVNFNWTTQVIPLQFSGVFMFNDQGQVKQYDMSLVRASFAFQTVAPTLVPLIAKELKQPIPRDQAGAFALLSKRAALDICEVHEKHCKGNLKQYKSKNACINFIAKEIPLGDIWQAGQNTALCRYIHKAMLPLRPEEHCQHVGPSGGGMCIQRDYKDTVLEKVFKTDFFQLPGDWSHKPPSF